MVEDVRLAHISHELKFWRFEIRLTLQARQGYICNDKCNYE